LFISTQTVRAQEIPISEPTVPSIQVKKSNSTVDGWFYRLEPIRDGCAELHEDEYIPGADTPVRYRPYDAPEYWRVDWADDVDVESRTRLLDECPLARKGLTDCPAVSVVQHWVVSVRGEPQYRLGDFGADCNFLYQRSGNRSGVISGRLADALRNSDLTGFGLGTTEIVNPSNDSPVDLAVLQFRGRHCLRPLTVVGAPDFCPLCGHEPLVCPDCGYFQSVCGKCGKNPWVIRQYHKGTHDARLIADVNRRELSVL